MMSYSLMALFRTFLLQEKTQKRFSILRYRTFKINASFKIALYKKRKLGFDGYWNYSKAYDFKFDISDE